MRSCDMYKLTSDDNIILRISDNAFIPKVNGNKEYEEYLQWLQEGNIPAPNDEV